MALHGDAGRPTKASTPDQVRGKPNAPYPLQGKNSGMRCRGYNYKRQIQKHWIPDRVGNDRKGGRSSLQHRRGTETLMRICQRQLDGDPYLVYGFPYEDDSQHRRLRDATVARRGGQTANDHLRTRGSGVATHSGRNVSQSGQGRHPPRAPDLAQWGATRGRVESCRTVFGNGRALIVGHRHQRPAVRRGQAI